MKQVTLGEVSVGAIAYGCWRFAGSTTAEADLKIETALDCGMTLIDTADIYGFGEPAGFGGAEQVLGDLLSAKPGLRARLVLATKGSITPPRPYDASYTYLMDALDASLKRLQTDYVDLYQIHRPDITAPIGETAAALDAMVRSGKARAVGISNYTAAQARALQAHMHTTLVSMQPEFSPICQDPITDGVLDWCMETQAACLAWSPLGGGRLLQPGEAGGQAQRVIAALNKIAEAHTGDIAQIALAFVRAHGAKVIPIIGTQTPDRIRAAAKAAEITLSAREFYDIIEAYRGVPMP
ncbi:MAG: aldo/keto reductase [Pseudomonadota bacterium]